MTKNNERAQCLDALPFYVNGTLPPQQRAEVDAWLEKYPDLRSQVPWLQNVRAHVSVTDNAALENISPAVGAARLRELLQQDKRSPASSMVTWWRNFSQAAWLPYGFAFAMLLLVVQTTGLGLLLADKESTDALGQERANQLIKRNERMGYIQINFKPDSNEHDVRMLLIRSGARLIDGPSQLGDYVLEVPQARLAQVSSELTQSPWVVATKVLPNVPRKD